MLADGEVVGRIYEPAGSRFDPPELRWFWSVMVTPATPGVTSGTAATRGSSTSIYNERGQLTGRAERRPDGSTSFFKRAWPVRRLDPTTLTRERNHMSRYLLVLVALLATSAAAAAEIPSHMRGKWCGVPDDTYVKGPCGDGSLDTDVEMTVAATGFKVNDTECKAIQVTRGAIKNPRSTPSYRFKFRCSDGKISEQEWWIEKDSYLLIDVKRRSSAEPSNPWGVAIENIVVETVHPGHDLRERMRPDT
jgi:hypothetical protein